jgi:hypothetical protein
VAETPREQLLQAVTGLLSGMTGARPAFGGGSYSYPNDPTVSVVYAMPGQVNKHPYIAVIEEADSQLLETEHDGTETDEFRFDLYGQVQRTEGVSARLWGNRLRFDAMRTLRAGTRVNGPLRALPASCSRVIYGREDIGFDDVHAEFLVPVTARLSYVLAPAP